MHEPMLRYKPFRYETDAEGKWPGRTSSWGMLPSLLVPGDITLIVNETSDNARHLLGRHKPRSVIKDLDGAGWIAGQEERDVS